MACFRLKMLIFGNWNWLARVVYQYQGGSEWSHSLPSLGVWHETVSSMLVGCASVQQREKHDSSSYYMQRLRLIQQSLELKLPDVQKPLLECLKFREVKGFSTLKP